MCTPNPSTRRTRARRIAAIAAIGAVTIGGALAAAGPAFASGPPPIPIGVTVNELVSVTLTAGQSGFTLTGSQTNAGALAWTVVSNDAAGYTQSLALPNLNKNGGGGLLPSGYLSEVNNYSTADHGTGTDPGVAMVNAGTPVPIRGDGAVSLPAGDTFSTDWTANAPGTQPAGTYSGTLTLTVTGA